MSSLLGKLKVGMNQAVSSAQEQLHVAQLRGQLRVIEREKTDQLTALGTALYAMHQAGEIRTETLHGQFQALDATEERLQAKQKEIDDYEAQTGAVAADDRPAAPPTPDRHCECGAILSPAAKFCPECGKASAVEPV